MERARPGRAVVRDLLEQDEDMLSVDLVRSSALSEADQLAADLTEYGQAVEAPRRARVGCAPPGRPRAGAAAGRAHVPGQHDERTHNVFSAAALLMVERVVWATSETVLVLPFERDPPAYAPIDEQHPPAEFFLRALETRGGGAGAPIPPLDGDPVRAAATLEPLG